jgi:phage terminase large subunit-like protein
MEMIGEPLLPWQRWAAIHALETVPGGAFRFRVVLVLVSRQNGKSHLGRAVTLWRMYIDGARLILGVAQDVSLAREQWQMCIDGINAAPDLAAELETVRRVNGDEQFRLTSGARYKIAASNRSAGRGLSIDQLNIDELREQRNWDAWSALSKTTMARHNSQIWCMSNAGDDESVVLNQLRDAALARRDPSIGIFEWSAPDGCELDDPKAWAQANPALGLTVSEAAIRSAMATDPPNVFRTEVLCQKVDQLDGAIDLAAWKACADPAGTMEGLRDRIVLCFDVAPDGAHSTLAAAAQLDDGRARVEIVRAWKTTEAARTELPELIERIKPQAVVWYPTGPAAAFAPMLRPDPRLHSRVQYVELTGMRVAEACQGLADLAATRRVVHNADPLLDSHVSAAQKMPAGDGWRFTRRGEGHVDAAYAAAGAVYVALVTPVVQRARIRMLG